MIANSVAGQDAITIIVFIIATNYPLIATSRENSLIQGISIAPAILLAGGVIPAQRRVVVATARPSFLTDHCSVPIVGRCPLMCGGISFARGKFLIRGTSPAILLAGGAIPAQHIVSWQRRDHLFPRTIVPSPFWAVHRVVATAGSSFPTDHCSVPILGRTSLWH